MPTRENPFVRAGREIGALLRGATYTHRELRDRLTVVVVVSLLVDVVCALLAYAFEHGAHDTDIHSLGSALFFSTTQLLSVSSSMTNPLSTGGRVLDVLMEIYAITVVTSLAGMTASFFHRRSRERQLP
jgi:hypothetical protein